MCVLEMKEVTSKPEWDMIQVYVYVAIAIITTLVVTLCLMAVLKV